MIEKILPNYITHHFTSYFKNILINLNNLMIADEG